MLAGHGHPRAAPGAGPDPDNDMWPPYARGRSLRQCLGTVLSEEFEHLRFCVRDLDLIERARLRFNV